MRFLPTTADVVVVGGGVHGLSIGAWLSLSGVRVVVCEKEVVGAGSSGRSGAVIRSFYHHPLLARAAQTCRKELWEPFEEILGVPEGSSRVFRKSGMLIFGPGSEKEELARHFQEAGVAIEALDRASVRERFEYLAPPNEGEVAWYEPGAGYARAVAVLSSTARRIEEGGGRVVENCRAGSAKRLRGGTWRLSTSLGDLTAGALVVATGPWLGKACRFVEGLGPLPVRPRKVQVLLVSRPPDTPSDPVTIGDFGLDFYSRSLPGQVSHVGFLSSFDQTDLREADDFDESIRNDLARHLALSLAARFPGTRGAPVHGHRSALYEVTPDENFILGRGPEPGLFLAGGGSGHSFKFAPLVGREMAKLILGEEATFVTDPTFAWDRDYGGESAFA